MKKKFWVMAIIGWLAICLAGCGSSSRGATTAPEEHIVMDAASQINAGDYGDADEEKAVQPAGNLQGAKRIYTAEFNMETTEFDTASAGLNALVNSFSGWVQGSSVEYGGSGYRYANYVVRIPQDKFEEFLNQVGGLCHITYRSTNVEDVTESYYDIEGRLTTQQTKLKRLQTLLAQAKNMEDIIAIEGAISDTEQEIESLSADLRHYDAQVDYATVNLTLGEVYQLSNVEEPATGFVSRVFKELSSGGHAFVLVVQSLVLTMAYAWVQLILAAVIFLWAFRVYRKRKAVKKNGNETTQKKKDDKQE